MEREKESTLTRKKRNLYINFLKYNKRMLTLQDEEIPLSLRQKSSYQERNFVRNAWENVTEHLTFVESSKHNLF